MMFSIDENLDLAAQAQQSGRFDESDRLAREIIAAEPAHIGAWQLLATGKFVQGRHAEALPVLTEALAHHPENFELQVLAGHSRRALGDLTAAAAHYQTAVDGRPQSAEARVMLGWTLRSLDRREDALAQYQQAVALNPDLVEAHNNLGVMHHDRGELDPAITHYRHVLERQPAHVEARRNLAAALRAQGRTEDALAQFEALLTFAPGHPYATLLAAQSKRELCRWQDWPAMVAQIKAVAESQAGAFSPFILFSWPIAPDILLNCARAYAARTTPPILAVAPAAQTKSKLRIGYISADFRAHVLAAVVPEVFELHDRTAFEIHAYSTGFNDGSAQRKRFERIVDAFHDISTLADDGAAQKIRADGIDILIDLTAFTGNIRHGIAARRPAPLQINWLGYPGTSGSPVIDYLVADAFAIPAGAEQYYSEKIIRLPGSSQPHDRTHAVAQPLTRADYGLPAQGFVFCCFNHVQKLSPDVFTAWMDILRAVPGSVLWLRADKNEAQANLRREAGARGIAAERLVFAGKTPDLASHLARYRIADLALDTFPYTSHTTANDALGQGCPLITVTGETFASRVAGAILNSLGLPDLVHSSLDNVRAHAVRLATQSSALTDVKARLAAGAANAAHFDAPRFVRHLEAGYRAAWNIRASGAESRHITVGADGKVA